MALPSASPGLAQRVWRNLLSRWHWRASRSRFPRLTLVSQFFPPDFAATGQLLDDLTARLAARGLQVQVLTGMPAYAFSRTDAERIEFQPGRCIRRTQASRFWPQRIRGRAINGVLFCLRITVRLLRYSRRGDLILYTTEPPYLPLLGWLLHRLTRTPYLVLLYDLYPDVLVELNVLAASHWLVRLWRQFNRWMFADAQELIVLSEPMADRMRQHAPVATTKLSVIPSWADSQRICPRAKDENWFVQREQLHDSFTVLYSGNQGRCHDLVTVLAAALLLRHDPGVQFLFIGNGPQNARLRGLVRDWGLRNCRFLPYQELSDLPFTLAAADLALVTLSIEAEGLVAPSKLYGHLAAATPIAAITPARSYLHELVEREGCGRWFANGDAEGLAGWIQQLRADPAAAAACGQAARRLLERTATPEIVTARYLQLIQQHLPEHKPLPASTEQQPRSAFVSTQPPDYPMTTPPASRPPEPAALAGVLERVAQLLLLIALAALLPGVFPFQPLAAAWSLRLGQILVEMAPVVLLALLCCLLAQHIHPPTGRRLAARIAGIGYGLYLALVPLLLLAYGTLWVSTDRETQQRLEALNTQAQQVQSRLQATPSAEELQSFNVQLEQQRRLMLQQRDQFQFSSLMATLRGALVAGVMAAGLRFVIRRANC